MGFILVPSVHGGSGAAKIYHAPVGKAPEDAIGEVNELLRAINLEDQANEDGGCDDGFSVEENVERRLVEAGFTPVDFSVARAWDAEAHEVPARGPGGP